MAFSVRFSEVGKEWLHKLNIDAQRTIRRRLKKIHTPEECGLPLTDSLAAFHSLHIGKYRVVLSVTSERAIVHVLGHRKDVYEIAQQLLGK